MSNWRKKNDARSREINRQSHAKVREEVITKYGSKCAVCGETDICVLEIDHIAGGGKKDRKTSSRSFFYKLRREDHQPERYRVLCKNHNWIAWLERKDELLKQAESISENTSD